MFRFSAFIYFFLFSIFVSYMAMADHGDEEKEWKCDSVAFFETYAHAGQEDYNNLLCEGTKYFETGLFEHAVEHYIKASNIKIFDIPNYTLNARIAHAYLLMGDLEKATHYIKESKMMLSLLIGILSCQKRGRYISPSTLIPPIVPEKQEPPLTLSQEIIDTICHDRSYHKYRIYSTDLSRALHNLVFGEKLVTYHLKVERLIKWRHRLEGDTG